MSTPEISIIIPVYNAEPYLEKCVDSVLSQTFTNFECILVDDKSTDRSPEICASYALKDKRVRVLKNKQNMGSSLTRKAALDVSSGRYIQCVDSDDWIESYMLEKLYNMTVSGNYDMIFCNAYIDSIDGTSKYNELTVEDDIIQNIKFFILTGIGIGVQYVFAQKSVFNNLKFPKEGYSEDKYIILQMFYNAKSIGHMKSAFYHVFQAPLSQMRNTTFKAKLHRYIGLKNNYRRVKLLLQEKYGGNLDIFEPELSVREGYITKAEAKYLEAKEKHDKEKAKQRKKNRKEKRAFCKRIIKKIVKTLIPFKPVRDKIKVFYKKITLYFTK